MLNYYSTIGEDGKEKFFFNLEFHDTIKSDWHKVISEKMPEKPQPVFEDTANILVSRRDIIDALYYLAGEDNRVDLTGADIADFKEGDDEYIQVVLPLGKLFDRSRILDIMENEIYAQLLDEVDKEEINESLDRIINTLSDVKNDEYVSFIWNGN